MNISPEVNVSKRFMMMKEVSKPAIGKSESDTRSKCLPAFEELVLLLQNA